MLLTVSAFSRVADDLHRLYRLQERQGVDE